MARPRSQPVREIPAGRHGQRQETTRLQQARPLPAPGSPTQGPPTTAQPGGSEAGAASPAPLPQPPNVFAPGSPGRRSEQAILPDDGLSLIRALYQVDPNPDLRRLLERAADMANGL